jgi:putative intracellular protease/amidase
MDNKMKYMGNNINQYTRKIFMFGGILLLGMTLGAQKKKDYNIGVFLYPGVDLLDFAGPAAVLASIPEFKVYTLSENGENILSQEILNIKPQYSINDAPVPDILIFPGGNVRVNFKNQKVLNWIDSCYLRGILMMSVCNGAGILAKAELLNGLTLTTFNGFVPVLKGMVKGSTVLENTKYVDNGNIITAGGVSAGIDGALHLVARIKGNEIAKSLASIMGFNSWNPNEGIDNHQNSFLGKFSPLVCGLDNKNENSQETTVLPAEIPYEGELKNLAEALIQQGCYLEAAGILERAVKWYPYSISSYKLLYTDYVKLGKPVPMDEMSFIKIVESGKAADAFSIYENTLKTFPNWPLFSEQALNAAGYRLLQKEDYSNAIKAFSLNTIAYPQSWNVWDSQGEALMKSGNKKEAITNYKKSLALNPNNSNARTQVARMENE